MQQNRFFFILYFFCFNFIFSYKINSYENKKILIFFHQEFFSEKQINSLKQIFLKNGYAIFFEENIDKKELTKEFIDDSSYVLTINFYENDFLSVLLIDSNTQKQSDRIFRRDEDFDLFQSFLLLKNDLGRVGYQDIAIEIMGGAEFSFDFSKFPGIKIGDEIELKSSNEVEMNQNYYALVNRISEGRVFCKRTEGLPTVFDKVLHLKPKRHRISIHLGAVVPVLGTERLYAHLNSSSWESDLFWPAGLQIELEYERFLPRSFVFTSVIGLNIYGFMGTSLLAGFAYRMIKNSWEVVCYFRCCAQIHPIVLKKRDGSTGSNHLSGMSFRYMGVNLGLNISKRVNSFLFLGCNIGLQYYPLETVYVLGGSERVYPFWNNHGKMTQQSSLAILYPYMHITVGYAF